MAEVHVEQAQPEDATELAKMQRRSWLEAYSSGAPTDRIVQESADRFIDPERIELRMQYILRALVNDDEELYLAAWVQSQIVGMLYGTKTDEAQEIVALYVEVDQKRRGIGRALVERFIEWSDSDRPVELGVIDDNTNAQAFYATMGFNAVPDSTHDFEAMEGFREIRMIREGDVK